MITIRDVTLDDAAELLAIYAPYVSDSVYTFEIEIPSLEEFRARIELYSSEYPYLVAENDGDNGPEILGYAYAHPLYARDGYRHSAETTIYIKQDARYSGIGNQLYSALLPRLKDMGIHACVALLGATNESSKIFHEKFGFEVCGGLRDVGFKFGQWLNNLYMEKIL